MYYGMIMLNGWVDLVHASRVIVAIMPSGEIEVTELGQDRARWKPAVVVRHFDPRDIMQMMHRALSVARAETKDSLTAASLIGDGEKLSPNLVVASVGMQSAPPAVSKEATSADARLLRLLETARAYFTPDEFDPQTLRNLPSLGDLYKAVKDLDDVRPATPPVSPASDPKPQPKVPDWMREAEIRRLSAELSEAMGAKVREYLQTLDWMPSNGVLDFIPAKAENVHITSGPLKVALWSIETTVYMTVLEQPDEARQFFDDQNRVDASYHPALASNFRIYLRGSAREHDTDIVKRDVANPVSAYVADAVRRIEACGKAKPWEQA